MMVAELVVPMVSVELGVAKMNIDILSDRYEKMNLIPIFSLIILGAISALKKSPNASLI